MLTNAASAAWAVDHPVLAKGRLLTATRELSSALQEIGRMIGYLDGVELTGATKPDATYIELGMNATQSRLLHVVRALDMAAEVPL